MVAERDCSGWFLTFGFLPLVRCNVCLGLSTSPIPCKAAGAFMGKWKNNTRLPMTPLEAKNEAPIKYASVPLHPYVALLPSSFPLPPLHSAYCVCALRHCLRTCKVSAGVDMCRRPTRNACYD